MKVLSLFFVINTSRLAGLRLRKQDFNISNFCFVLTKNLLWNSKVSTWLFSFWERELCYCCAQVNSCRLVFLAIHSISLLLGLLEILGLRLNYWGVAWTSWCSMGLITSLILYKLRSAVHLWKTNHQILLECCCMQVAQTPSSIRWPQPLCFTSQWCILRIIPWTCPGFISKASTNSKSAFWSNAQRKWEMGAQLWKPH